MEQEPGIERPTILQKVIYNDKKSILYQELEESTYKKEIYYLTKSQNSPKELICLMISRIEYQCHGYVMCDMHYILCKYRQFYNVYFFFVMVL